jgi:hypothetical protein
MPLSRRNGISGNAVTRLFLMEVEQFTEAEMNKVPIAFVAKMLNTTISKAQRKFGGKGHIDMEELIEWVERHSDNVNYFRWIEMIKKAEENLAKEPRAEVNGEVIPDRLPGPGSSIKQK